MWARDSLVQLLAGATGGTLGAVVTCPLEVVKTRLQSSQSAAERRSAGGALYAEGNSVARLQRRVLSTRLDSFASLVGRTGLPGPNCCYAGRVNTASPPLPPPPPPTAAAAVRSPLRHGLAGSLYAIVEREGVLALFKGLGPNLVGVAPSRAIYFCAYQNAKDFFNSGRLPADSAAVHVASAISAGFTCSTLANPVWVVKTRLQLDRQRFGSRLKVSQCWANIYARDGVRGFYKGVSASYYGVVETVIHFVIYERLKQFLDARRHCCQAGDDSGAPGSLTLSPPDGSEQQQQPVRTGRHFFEFMMAAAFSKTIASTAAYPHEVARTRLREDGDRYRAFFQTLRLVWLEEGWRGLYSGLGVQLLRQIPNTAILMATYEACVYFLK